MNNQTITNQLSNIAHRDSELIISGSVKMPTRDDSGNRPLTPGEKTILDYYSPEARQIHNEIKKADEELTNCDDEFEVIGQEVKDKTIKYTQEKQDIDAELEQNQQQMDLLEQDTPSDDSDDDHPEPKRKSRKEGAKKMFSFVSIAFVAEVVTSLATINLQQETLSMDVILWRFAYILVIYVFTCILYAKYLKTGIKAVKGLLVGCFLMSLACLLHAVVLTFINIDVAAPAATADFNLNTVETAVEETANGGILANFINNPGLIEFIIATLLVFAGEILTIDVKNKQMEEPTETTQCTALSFENVDFDAVEQGIVNRQKNKLEKKQKKLLDDRNQKTVSFGSFGIKTGNRLEENKNRKEDAREAKEKAIQKEKEFIEKVHRVVYQYGNKALKRELAITLGVAVSSIKFEPILEEDVEAHFIEILDNQNN